MSYVLLIQFAYLAGLKLAQKGMVWLLTTEPTGKSVQPALFLLDVIPLGTPLPSTHTCNRVFLLSGFFPPAKGREIDMLTSDSPSV